MLIDLGAETTAENRQEKIAVEIKRGSSVLRMVFCQKKRL